MMMQSFSLVFLSCYDLHLWWLISSVNLTWPECPDTWSNSILAISVKVFHWVGQMFKSVNFESSRLPSIIWAGLIQPVKDLNRTKTNLPLCLQKKEFCQQTVFGLELEVPALLEPANLPCRLWTCQASVICISKTNAMYIYTSCYFCFSGKHWWIQQEQNPIQDGDYL